MAKSRGAALNLIHPKQSFERASKMKARFLVRASWHRRIDHEEEYLWKHVEAQEVAATLEMVVPLEKQKKTPTATIEIRFAPVRIFEPYRRRSKKPPVDLHAVYVHEPHPPEGLEALS